MPRSALLEDALAIYDARRRRARCGACRNDAARHVSRASPASATKSLVRLERAFEVLSTGRARRDDLAELAAAHAGARLLVQRRPRARVRLGQISRSTSPRRTACRRPLVHATSRKGGRRSTAAVIIEESLALMRHGLAFSLEHELSERRRDVLLHAVGPGRSARTAPRRTRLPPRGARAGAVAQGSRPREWASAGGAHVPALAARPLGRRASRPRRRSTEEQIHAGGVMLSVLQAGTAIYIAARRPRRGSRACTSCSRSLRRRRPIIQDQGTYGAATRDAAPRRRPARGGGRGRHARRSSSPACSGRRSRAIKHGVVDALEAALALGDRTRGGRSCSRSSTAFHSRQPLAVPRSRTIAAAAGAGRSSDAAGLEAAADDFREGSNSPFQGRRRRCSSTRS